MKDSYTLDYTEEGLDIAYEKHADAYRQIFTRCALKYFEVGASSGLMGGSASQEFMIESVVGEDTVALCDDCGYAANAEIANFKIETLNDPKYKELNKMRYKKMTNKQIQKNLVKDMKQDESLKEYAKDIEELNQKSFSVLIKVLKKFNTLKK